MSKTEVAPEHWHKKMMEVSWTDSGKLFLRHALKTGGRISYPIEIDPHIADQMSRHEDA